MNCCRWKNAEKYPVPDRITESAFFQYGVYHWYRRRWLYAATAPQRRRNICSLPGKGNLDQDAPVSHRDRRLPCSAGSFACDPHQKATLVVLRNNQRVDLKYFPAQKMTLPQLKGRLSE